MYRYKYHRFGNSHKIVSNILNILKKIGLQARDRETDMSYSQSHTHT